RRALPHRTALVRAAEAHRERSGVDRGLDREEASQRQRCVRSVGDGLEHHGPRRSSGYLERRDAQAGGRLMLRTEKVTAIEDIKQRFDRMTSAVFVDFTGMTVAEIEGLRNTFRERGVEYKVVKNTLVKRALLDQPYA